MISDKTQSRIQLILGGLLALSGAYIIWENRADPDSWVIASVLVVVTAMIWSGLAKVPVGLMFLFSVTAMFFAIIYWPVPKGANMSEQRLSIDAFYHSFWYFLVFLLFGYLYWYNRKRW